MSLGQQLEHPLADQPGALGIERDLPAVEVVAGLLAGGEREVAELQRLFAHQLLERFAVVHEVRSRAEGREPENFNSAFSATKLVAGNLTNNLQLTTCQ